MRRVDCLRCKAVVIEEVPWGNGKHQLTNAYMLFLARWARRLSRKETAEAFRTSWDKVFDASKGHKYLTLVYQEEVKDRIRLLGHVGILSESRPRENAPMPGTFSTVSILWRK